MVVAVTAVTAVTVEVDFACQSLAQIGKVWHLECRKVMAAAVRVDRKEMAAAAN